MSNSQLPPPKALNLHEGNIAEHWRKFKQQWQLYEIAAGFEPRTAKVRTAAFLSVIGEAALEVYATFEWADDADKLKPDVVLQKFEDYCIPRSSVLFETYKFGTRTQEELESIDSYVTALRRIAENCAFGDKDRRIRDQIVLGIRNNHVRERILREVDPDLQRVLEIVRATEIAEKQSKEISRDLAAEQIHHMDKKSHPKEQRGRKQSNKSSGTSQSNPKTEQSTLKCKFCGRTHEKKKEKCPAWQKTCKTCGKQNHFSCCCSQSKSVDAKTIEIYSVGAESPKKKTKTVTMSETGEQLKFHIDTGASCNVISYNDYQRVTGDRKGQLLKPKSVCLVTYGGKTWSSAGERNIPVEVDGRKTQLPCVIVNIKAQPLLSLQSCENLGIVKILSCDEEINSVTTSTSTEKIVQTFDDVFQGLGKLQGKYKISIDEAVKPVVHAPRKVPVALRDSVKKTLDELEKDDVIARVTEPTDWVSSMMLVQKPGKLRICLDPRDLNVAIKREHYPLPTIEEVASRMRPAKFRLFSVLDAKNGFWQVELEEKSSYLTTFNTPFGRYRWKRMPFGINSAPEVWQRKMHEIADLLEGVEVVADDFLVCGSGESYEEAVTAHDQNLVNLLERARQSNLKLNKKKLRLKLTEVQFIGHILCKDGLKPDPKKIEALVKMPAPVDVKDVMRFLGMVQYLSKFIPNLSTITVPLRRLTDKGADWIWSPEAEKAFQDVKMLLVKAPVLTYFDPKLPVTIQCDASEKGIGAVLMQNGKPVAYSSRAMTRTEQNYAQIEKEMLAIVHACTKFEQFIYCHPNVTVESDHKPLEMICKKPMNSAPKRLQRMLLYLQKYKFKVVYKKGAHLYIADTLSRAYLPNATQPEEFMDVCYVREQALMSELEKTSMLEDTPNDKKRMKKIEEASGRDPVLQKAMNFILTGWPADKKTIEPSLVPYFNIRDELSTESSLIFKGDRVVIPAELRAESMNLLHRSHLGVEGCLRRARDHVYWPGMNSQFKDYIMKCDICNSFRAEQQKEPLLSHDVPSRPWSVVSTDIFELNKSQYLVAVDHYTNFIEFEKLVTATSKSVIVCLKRIFARYGIPEKLISDNGRNCVSAEFKKFASDWEFQHVTSSPHYAQSNGKAENAVKTCKRLMKKALAGDSDFYLTLLDFRNTPSDIGYSPAQRMFGRRTRSVIPAKPELWNPHPVPDLKRKLEKSKATQAKFFDRGSKELSTLKKGDVVRMKLPNSAQWSKGEVLGGAGKRSYQVNVDGSVYRRNRRQLIKTPEPRKEPEVSTSLPVVDPMVPPADEDSPLRRSSRIRREPDRYSQGT